MRSMRTHTNKFEAAARTAKASKMANVLIAHGSDAETAAALPARGRMMVAELAGCRVPSETTWALVVEMVAADALFSAVA
jgi:hypothetical protein